MTEDLYKRLYEQNSEGIKSVYDLREEFQDFKTKVECHIEGDKLRDYKLDNLIKVITVDNGQKSFMTRLQTLERYVSYAIGIAGFIGVVWGVVVFIVPLIVGRAK